MEFKHINDVWEYLRGSTDYNDLKERIGEIPNKYGTWDILPSEDHKCLVVNSYYEELYQSWDQDIEEFDIVFPEENINK